MTIRKLFVLGDDLAFPDARCAGPDGLVAMGGDLSVERLLLAYRSGIFPWTVDPITWWSPDPRSIFDWNHLHVPRSLHRVLRQNQFRVTLDRAFRSIIECCAAPSASRRETWISPEFIQAYTRLHQRGYAHSLECWTDGTLAGGIYGVAIGGFFAGESMFHSVSNASKVALCRLLDHLRLRGYELFDVQMLTPVTQQLGAVTISRDAYLARLAHALKRPCTFAAEQCGKP